MTALPYRRQFRAALAEPAAISPASVFDPLSARIAEVVGFRIGVLAGSMASLSGLAAPDLIITTLTEVAEQVRRIMRVSDLGLFIDADHGYGNALNVFRTIEELEHAGAAAVSIEDTLLPQPFGSEGAAEQVISAAEMVGKLRAAVAARRDPDFAVIGRTSSLRIEGIARAAERVRAYAETGIDALFAVGMQNLEQVRILREAAGGLPIIAGPSLKAQAADRQALATAGVALHLRGHQPIAAAAKALHETYAHLHAERPEKDLAGLLASSEDMDRLMQTDKFAEMQKRFLS